MTNWPRPTPEHQLEFLQRIQSLFDDGDFAATYKFALLMSLAELAVERGTDDGRPLDLDLIQVGEKFAELYWPQSIPYSSGATGASVDILAQNRGAQAAVINELLQLRSSGANTLSQAKQLRQWPDAVRRISRVVRQMPVQFLQNIGGTTVPFLYDFPPPIGKLVLNPGVTFLLRLFHGLIQQLARAAWISHIRQNSRNTPIIGQADDLESFMFGTPRQNLQAVAVTLAGIQSGRCFYCGDPIHGSGDVDHFIPWTRYPRDLAHNFVLAHVACNRHKSDMLAAKPHLDRWLERNELHGDEIAGRARASGFLADKNCTRTVAKWAYSQGASSAGIAWIRDKITEPISDQYLASLL
jgi:5-methylcytosine-specific restriction endonuclease McrA